MIKRKVANIPLAAGKSKMFSIGCLKFLDSCNFLAMPLDEVAKIYGCKTKILYPYEYFVLDTWGTTTKSYDSEAANGSKATYQEVLGYLKKRGLQILTT